MPPPTLTTNVITLLKIPKKIGRFSYLNHHLRFVADQSEREREFGKHLQGLTGDSRGNLCLCCRKFCALH